MGVRQVGPPLHGAGDSSQTKRKDSNRSFAGVLESATTEKTKRIKEPLQNEAFVKKEMATLLRGGESKKLVETALRQHPLFGNLPAKAKEDLIAQVTATINPMIKGA